MSLALFTGGAPGPLEIILILVVILLLFGAKKLPELSRSLGRSLSEFKKGRAEGEKESREAEKQKQETGPGEGDGNGTPTHPAGSA